MDRLLFSVYFGHDNAAALYGGTVDLDLEPHDDRAALGLFHHGTYKPAERLAISALFPAYGVAFADRAAEFTVFVLGRYVGDPFVGTMVNSRLKTEPIPICLQRLASPEKPEDIRHS